MTVATAKDNKVEVVVSENGQAGLPGINGTDGAGFNSVRKSLLDNPLLHILKKNELENALSGSITWSRTTPASTYGIYGVEQISPVNTPREEVSGWLSEGSSTNQTLQSETFNQSPWLIAGSPTLTITQDGTLSSDGLVQAWRIGKTAAGDPRLQQNATSFSQVANTSSIDVKRGDSDLINFRSGEFDSQKNSVFDFSTGSFASSEHDRVSVKKLANGWFRISATETPTAGVGVYIFSIQVKAVTGFFYASKAQREENGFSTSYIITTTSPATRTSDNISLPALGNFPALKNQWTIATNLKAPLPSAISPYRVLVIEDDNVNVNVRINSVGQLFYQDSGGSYSFGVVANKDDVKFNLCLTYDGSTMTAYIDGIFAASITVSTTSFDTAADIAIYSGFGGGYLNGSGYDFRVYDFTLNSDEAKFLAGV